MKNERFRVKYHLYLQWKPTQEEYQFLKENPKDGDQLFTPSFEPSNALEFNDSRIEESHPYKSIHILEHGGRDVWGALVSLKSDEVLFGISTYNDAVISSSFSLKTFPFDFQNLHMFFESLSLTDKILLFPTTINETVLDFELGALASDSMYLQHTPVVEFNAFNSSSYEDM